MSSLRNPARLGRTPLLASHSWMPAARGKVAPSLELRQRRAPGRRGSGSTRGARTSRSARPRPTPPEGGPSRPHAHPPSAERGYLRRRPHGPQGRPKGGRGGARWAGPGSSAPPPPHRSRRDPSGSQRRRRLPTPHSLSARRLPEPLPQLLIGRSAHPSLALIGQPARWDGPRTFWTHSPRCRGRRFAAGGHPGATLQTQKSGSCPSALSGASCPSSGRS